MWPYTSLRSAAAASFQRTGSFSFFPFSSLGLVTFLHSVDDDGNGDGCSGNNHARNQPAHEHVQS